MNKNHGVLAGSVLAIAVLLRPAGVNIAAPPGPVGPLQALPGALAAGQKKPAEAADGPWLASCSYWAPVRSFADNESRSEKDGAISSTDRLGDALKGMLEQPNDSGCG